MRDIARSLNYQGPVSGFNMPAYPNKKDGTADTTYIEYRRNALNGTCKIYYKRMSKMDVSAGPNPIADPIQRITARKGAFVVENPTVNVATNAAIIATYWNKGEMHEVPDREIDTFNIS